MTTELNNEHFDDHVEHLNLQNNDTKPHNKKKTDLEDSQESLYREYDKVEGLEDYFEYLKQYEEEDYTQS